MVKRIKIEQEKNEVEEKIIEMLLEKAKAGETTEDVKNYKFYLHLEV